MTGSSMKTVKLHQISPTKGLQIPLNDQEPWFLEVVDNVLSDRHIDKTTLKGELDLRKTNNIVNILGNLAFTLNPLCARCGESLTRKENLTIQSHQAPLEEVKPKSKKNKEEEEIELTSDDLNFSFYENDEIHIDQILNDEVALALPYNYYCQNNPQCHPQMPASKHVTVGDGTDPRWAALKDLKIERK